MADVTFQRPEYKAKLDSWKLVRDAVAGGEAVQAGGYIPEVNKHDTSDANVNRNADRLQGAVYVNATGRTLAALSGVAFGKWPEVILPASLEYLEDDADGSGVGLINQAQLTVNEVMQTARAGLLVDYPSAAAPASRAQQDAGELRATIAFYAAEAVINWRSVKRGAQNVLGMVVLAETVDEWNGFELIQVPQYRVLSLGRLSTEDETAQERYVVQIYRKGNAAWEVVEEYAPLNGSSQPWKVIPFTFIGATNNDSSPDQSPLYDLASLNIAHYRNSADHEEALHFAAQPQVWFTDVENPEAFMELMEKNGIYVGSRAIGIAPGGVQILQSAPVSALAEEMGTKMDSMAALGARLVTPGEATKTATQSSGEEKTSHSVLSLVCDNVSDAYRKALGWCADFMRVSGKIDFTIGTEFAGIQFDAQQMAQALAAVQSGKLPEADFWTYCRSIGLIAADKTDDEIRGEVEAQAPPLVLDVLPGENVNANGAG